LLAAYWRIVGDDECAQLRHRQLRQRQHGGLDVVVNFVIAEFVMMTDRSSSELARCGQCHGRQGFDRPVPGINRPSLCCMRVYPTATSRSDAKTAALGLTFELNDALLGGSRTKRDRGGFEMTFIGYARVSTADQDLSIQEAALKAAGCEVIRAEKRSAPPTRGREELRTVLDFLRKGDVLKVTRIDRLARSIGDLEDIVRAVRAKGASLKATEQPIDTGTAAGKCFLDMLGVFAEFETNLRRDS
jgi:hypothetical protein